MVRRYFALFVTLAIAFLQIFMLARVPQNPDGAELVMTALRGGILHPPGYPVQAWIDRIFILLPFGQPATRLAFFSLLANAGSVYLLVGIIARLGGSIWARLLAVVLFALFPSVWYLAVQPEKYALTSFLIVASIFCGLGWLEERAVPFSTSDSMLLGLFAGLALGSHPLTGVAAVPLIVVLILARSKTMKQAFVSGILIAGFATALTLSLYCSLLWLHSSDSFPDWGKLQTFTGALRHMARLDFNPNPFGLTPGPVDEFSGLAVFFNDILVSWNIFIPLLAFGLLELGRKRAFPQLFLLLGTLGCSLGFLSNARLATGYLVSTGYLERYSCIAVIPFSILIAMGFDALHKRLRGNAELFAPMAVVAFVVFSLAHGWASSNASTDQTLELYRKGISVLLPRDAFYVGGNDVEAFWGTTLDYKTYRFPIGGTYPWFMERAMPIVEPRVSNIVPKPTNLDEIIHWAFTHGFPVVSTNKKMLEPLQHPAQLRGLFWLTQADISKPNSKETALAAAKLCEVFVKSEFHIHRQGHYWSQFLWERFREAFYSAMAFADATGNGNVSISAKEVALAILDGDSTKLQRDACPAFMTAVQQAYSGP